MQEGCTQERCSFENIEIYSDVGKVEEESSITKMSKEGHIKSAEEARNKKERREKKAV